MNARRAMALLSIPSLLSAQWRDFREAPHPVPRAQAGFAYSLTSGRCVMFGGLAIGGGLLGDTWSFDGQVWAHHAGPGPQLRRIAGMTYDVARGVVVLFGGESGFTVLNDTWEWNGVSWSAVATPTRPTAVQRPTLAFDLRRSRTVMLTESSQTWEYDGVTWSRVFTLNAPPPRGAPAMCFDLGLGKIVMVGGGTPFSLTNTDTWVYDGSDWIEVVVPGPPPRTEAQMAYDWDKGRCVLVGGVGPMFAPRTDAWEFDGATWSQVPAPPTMGIAQYTSYDIARGQVVVASCGDPGPFTITWVRGASASAFGTGCVGTAGQPELTCNLPFVGAPLRATLTRLNPTRSAAAILIGLSRTAWSGGTLPADLEPFGMPGCSLWSSIDGVWWMPASNGVGVWTTVIPNQSALVGAEAFLTGVSFDDANAMGAVLTRPLRLILDR